MTTYHFEVPGQPQAWKRVKQFASHGKSWSYNPNENVNSQKTIRDYAMASGVKITDSLVKLSIIFYMKRPKSLMKKSSPKESFPCIKRPDLDNLVKQYLDALTFVAYRDDSQVYSLIAEKRYHMIGEIPTTYVEIKVIKGG